MSPMSKDGTQLFVREDAKPEFFVEFNEEDGCLTSRIVGHCMGPDSFVVFHPWDLGQDVDTRQEK